MKLALISTIVSLLAGSVAAHDYSIDTTNLILKKTSADCDEYSGTYSAEVEDISRQKMLQSKVQITIEGDDCVLRSNGIPNHDFNDVTANFASSAKALEATFRIPRNPEISGKSTALSQRSYDGIMLNGVPIDLLSAGCYRPDGNRADSNGNVLGGCRDTEPWLLDPPAYDKHFGVDLHNAHVQPDGRYHYHANPNALFIDHDLSEISPVIGFAADGFPIFGSNFRDENGQIRPAQPGYQLKTVPRPAPPNGPGGVPDGTYIEDYEFTGVGDLDECNGMTVDGQYGYYVTNAFPWILSCFSGTPDRSFQKRK